ncbi:hypothetical protein [Acinetobacter geminorum]
MFPNQLIFALDDEIMREAIGDIFLMYPDIEVIATQTCVSSTDTQVELCYLGYSAT